MKVTVKLGYHYHDYYAVSPPTSMLRGNQQGLNRRQALRIFGASFAIGTVSLKAGRSVAARTPTESSWPTFQFDNGRSGYNPHGRRPTGKITKLWETTDGSFSSSPAVVGELLYHGTAANGLFAYDVEDGSTVWNSPTNGRIAPSRPTVADGVVYIGDWEHIFYAFDSTTGSERWRYDAGAILNHDSVVADGVVYFSDANGVIHAVSAADGTPIWTLDTGFGITSLAMSDGCLFFGGSNSRISRLDAATGAVEWSHHVPYSPRHIVLVDGIVYVGGWPYLATYNAVDGTERWRVYVGTISNSPAISDRLIYLGSTNNQLLAFDRATGEEQWAFTVGEHQIQGIVSDPAVVQNRVYFGGYDGYVYELHARTGKLMWAFDTGTEITGSPAVVNRRLYIGSRLGGMYAFG